jgi:4-aminobutyrate aminotransferase/(S)-3-amino-2-methylpropionate transaminase
MASNAELFDRRMSAIPRGVGNATQAFAMRARNAEIWDVENRHYIDFAAGIAVLNTGHCHPKVMEAARAQLECFTHTAFQVMAYENYIRLAERLNALAPFSGESQTILFTTGAEAVENAVKIARGATGRSAVVAFAGAFHGRTLLTMALTGKTSPYKSGFGAMPPEIFHLPFPVEEDGISAADSLRALDLLFASDVDPGRVAAIIIEPVQGEGGFHVAPAELLRALRAICDRHAIVLIVDEVQTGIARTGKMFGIEHSGVEPDLLTVAKSLGGGFPLSGVIGKKSIMDRIDPGGLGGTYAGSPVACAAALAVLDVVEQENLADRARMAGHALCARLERLRERNDLVAISPPRGLGAMIAVDILAARGEQGGDGALAKKVVNRAFENGLIVLTCGRSGQALRFLAPLTIEDDVLEEGLKRLERSLKLEAAA